MDAHPYPAEDWLRYQLPTFFGARDSGRIMLTGPSSVRENLIYDRFESERKKRNRLLVCGFLVVVALFAALIRIKRPQAGQEAAAQRRRQLAATPRATRSR